MRWLAGPTGGFSRGMDRASGPSPRLAPVAAPATAARAKRPAHARILCEVPAPVKPGRRTSAGPGSASGRTAWTNARKEWLLPTGCQSGGGSPVAWLPGMGEDGLGRIHFEQKGTP